MAEVQFPVEARNFSFLHSAHTGSGVYIDCYTMGIGCSFPGVTVPGRQADHLSPASAKVKNGGSTPPHCHSLHDVVLN
jgi:hypothetical protein